LDRIEFEEPEFSTCDCCGGTTTSLTRFVTRDEAAFAVYFCRFSDHHEDGYVSVLAGFGDWSDDADTTQRTAIAFRIWTTDKSYHVGLVDAENDGWKTDYLARKISREDALAHPLRQEVFDLSDHIVDCDGPIIAYLNRKT